MYKKICLLGDKNQFLPFNYRQPSQKALEMMGFNSGNNVFGFALQKMTLTENRCVDMLPLSYFFNHIEEINEKYEAILYSPANILAPWCKNTGLKYWTDALKVIKLPTYFVGIGTQATDYNNFDFIKEFKEEGYNFIKLLLETGGQIAIRGYFTGEVIKKLGFSEHDFSVIGCPSLFMNGANLRIEKKNLQNKEIKPIFNGNHFWFTDKFHKIFGQYSNSIFICQDLLYRLLYSPSELNDDDADYLRSDLFEWLFKSHRVRLYCDYLSWQKDIINEKFNFSIGSRIHGNIVSILAGIPSYIDTCDARVREMAEFFDIPHGNISSENIDLYKIYQDISFYKFNATFSEKFNNFKKFMNRNGIPCFENQQYIDDYISQLHFKSPTYISSDKEIHEFTNKHWDKYYPGCKR